MKKLNSTLRNNLIEIVFMGIGVFLMLLILEFLHLFSGNTIIFPSLNEIFQAFGRFLSQKSTYIGIGYTLLRTLLSLLISFVFAFIFGILGGLFKKVDLILRPIIATFKCIPVPCFVFIIFVYLPLNKLVGAIIIVFMVIFPIMYEGIKSGINNLDENIIRSLRIEGLYNFNSIFKVMIPLAFQVEITAEVLMNSLTLEGLGRILYLSYTNNEFVNIYALIIIILIIFIILDSLIYLIKRNFLKK